MGQYLRERYPHCPFIFHDAAIGGTGSELGMFRVERDVLAHDPDLVFLDFTINDDAAGRDPVRLASYESILRRLIQRGVPVKQVLLCERTQLGEHYTLEKLHRYQDHLKLDAAYGAGVGDALTYLQQQVS